MKVVLICAIFYTLYIFGANGSASDTTKNNLIQTLKDGFLKNGFPRLSAYDAAKLVDETQELYVDLKAKLQSSKLGKSTTTELNSEVIGNGFSVLILLQKLYTDSLTAFDGVLDQLVEIRKEQRAANLNTGEAFLGMYEAITKGEDADEGESFMGSLRELVTSLSTANQDLVKGMYKLAKKRKDLRKVMDIHENTAAELKKICSKYVKMAKLPTEMEGKICGVAEPVVTLIVLGSHYGFVN